MAERSEGLHVVADIGRRAKAAGMAKVHDREGHMTDWHVRCTGGVGRERDPRTHPVPVFDESLRCTGPITDPPVEGGEDVAREIFLPCAIDRSEDVAPAVWIDRVRGLREE